MMMLIHKEYCDNRRKMAQNALDEFKEFLKKGEDGKMNKNLILEWLLPKLCNLLPPQNGDIYGLHVAQLFCSQLQDNQVAQLQQPPTMSQEIKRKTQLGGESVLLHELQKNGQLVVEQLQREEVAMPESDDELRNLVLQLLDNFSSESEVVQQLKHLTTGNMPMLPSKLIGIIAEQLRKNQHLAHSANGRRRRRRDDHSELYQQSLVALLFLMLLARNTRGISVVCLLRPAVLGFLLCLMFLASLVGMK